MDSKFYKGSLESIILKMLGQHEEMYGYQITKLIKEQTNNEIRIKEGSLYPLLHKMESKGIIESTIRQVNNRPRKYYRITKKGIAESELMFNEIEKYMQIMTSFFHPKLT